MTTAPAEEQQSSEESGTNFASEGTGNKKKGGEKHYRGVIYDKAEAAAVAYDRKAFEIRGSRAILNFPLNVESGQYVDPFPQSPSSHTPSSIPRKRKT
ncbi:hypothetical protein SUGI_0583590 [Cryptomeria japonica]|nr:hypothetical protein SUGI_0583590 [Cryptomeria japonica]